MSMRIDWRLVADRELNTEELEEIYFSANYIPSLFSLKEMEECGGEAEFFTESNFAMQDMRGVLERFTARHEDVSILCFYHYDGAICPDGFEAKRGKLREFTGEVRYTWDDSKTEVFV